MAIGSHERFALEKRIVAIGALIDEMDSNPDVEPNPLDAAIRSDRANLFREQVRLQIVLDDD